MIKLGAEQIDGLAHTIREIEDKYTRQIHAYVWVGVCAGQIEGFNVARFIGLCGLEHRNSVALSPEPAKV